MQLSTSSFPEIPWESLSFRTTLRFRQASTTWDSPTSPVGSSPAFLRYSLLHNLRYQLIQCISAEFIERLILDEAEIVCRIFCGKRITIVCVGFKHFLPFRFLFSFKEYWCWFFFSIAVDNYWCKDLFKKLKENFGDIRSLPLPACPLVLLPKTIPHLKPIGRTHGKEDIIYFNLL